MPPFYKRLLFDGDGVHSAVEQPRYISGKIHTGEPGYQIHTRLAADEPDAASELRLHTGDQMIPPCFVFPVHAPYVALKPASAYKRCQRELIDRVRVMV